MLDLISKAQKGNDQAFLALFQKYEQDLYRMAFVYVKNSNDALDVVQETAYRAFKTVNHVTEPKYFKTWLIKIVINCSIDLLRKKKKVALLKPAIAESITDEVNENIDLEMTIRDLIESLDENEKSVIMLRFYEDLTIKEIAKILDVPLGTTKTILYRALNKLRDHLKGDDLYE